jgi:protein tyrosine phosphatase (PTP) superfamily phosphohydrolase (DUF442 family)
MDFRANRPDPSRALRVLPFLVLVASVAPRLSGAATITPEQAGIGNFGQVNENYFRGAQPDQAAFQRLSKLGVKTIIDLQEKGKDWEAGVVQTAGMKYFCVPLSGNHPATDAQTAQFLALVNDPANQPVYVHCAAGRHRTGEMTGIYRITHDSWTADHAYQEMQKYGYYSFPFHGSLKQYVYDYYGRSLSSANAKLATRLPAAAADSSSATSAPVVVSQAGTP